MPNKCSLNKRWTVKAYNHFTGTIIHTYALTNDATHCCRYFSGFFMLEDVELSHKGQKYILVQNDLNNCMLSLLNHDNKQTIQ